MSAPTVLSRHGSRDTAHEVDKSLGDLYLIGCPFLERNQRHVLILDRQLMQLAAGDQLLRGPPAGRIMGVVVARGGDVRRLDPAWLFVGLPHDAAIVPSPIHLSPIPHP